MYFITWFVNVSHILAGVMERALLTRKIRVLILKFYYLIFFLTLINAMLCACLALSVDLIINKYISVCMFVCYFSHEDIFLVFCKNVINVCSIIHEP